MSWDQEVAWTRRQWELLHDGGTWSIPRSGLVLQKREAERKLVVAARMPYINGMPVTAEQYAEQQQTELDGIAARLAEFGVTIEAGE